jgi:Flp pilus assembly protein TadG
MSGLCGRAAAVQRGQGLIEFALVMPIFIVAVFAVMESALLINAQLTIDNAAREGARIGSLCGNTRGQWIAPDGQPYGNGAVGSPCPQAMDQTVTSHLGILVQTGTNPQISTSASSGGSSSACGSSSTYYAAPGCVITVTVNYTYNYYLNFLVGPAAPSINLTSTATTVSQQ